MKPEKKMPQSTIKEWAEIGVPENWAYVLRKGYSIRDVAKLSGKGVGNSWVRLSNCSRVTKGVFISTHFYSVVTISIARVYLTGS